MKKILIVDDNKDILDLLEVYLEDLNYKVLTLLEGNQVIKTVDEFTPDLILLDVFLGGVNGVDICKELKADPEKQTIPIVMFSAHSKAELIANDCNAEGFISKPFNIIDLANTLKLHLN